MDGPGPLVDGHRHGGPGDDRNRPASADLYAANLATQQAALAALDAYSADVLTSVPEQTRILVTAHDAFGYFGRHYGFEVLGIQGISTESEAGLARIGELVDILVERGSRPSLSKAPFRTVRCGR